jgi:peptide deformylase
MKTIVQKEAKILREKAKEVPIKKITSPRIRKIIAEMKTALASQDDGVAIAAPQIGEPLRIFVVSGKVENLMKSDKDDAKAATAPTTAADSVYINPIITKLSKEKNMTEEGCLSVRYLYGKVKRSKKAAVQAYDENGKKFIRGGVGLLAQIFQHETDHLNGILFTDKAKNLEEIPPEKMAGRK